MTIPIKITLIIVGPNGCGKTCTATAYQMKQPVSWCDATIGVQYFCRKFEMDNKQVSLRIWDTDGHEAYCSTRHIYYIGADICLIGFSINDHCQFTDIQRRWVDEVKLIRPNIPLILVGMKKDLRPKGQSNDSFVSFDEGMEMSKNIGASAYFECSAKFNEGITEIFQSAVHITLQEKSKEIEVDAADQFCRCCKCSIL